jgi:hypothetical protein
MLAALVTASAATIVQPSVAGTADACAEVLPQSLHAAIARSYAGSVLVRESDYDPAIFSSSDRSPDDGPCIGAASADVNGDGHKDFAVLIASSSGDAVIVAALAGSGGRWQLSILETFSQDSIPRGYFVRTLEAKTYRDMYASETGPDDFRPEPGRLRRYTSRRPGFGVGKVDSSLVAYFYNGSRWVHLWLSD